MNKALKEKAKSLCKNCGISDGNLDAVINAIGGRVADDCTDATEIDKVANEILAVAKAMQSEASSRVEDFKKKNPVKTSKVEKPVDDENDDDKDDPSKSKDFSAMLEAAVAKAVKPLQDEISSFRANNVATLRLNALNEKLAACKDENFKAQTLKAFNRMSFKDDEDFNSYLTETESDIAAANQSKADAELRSNGAPMFSQKNEEGVSSAVAGYIKSHEKSDGGQFDGKKL